MTSTKIKVPHLESGDRLTRQEFERRYHIMPNVKKTELIEGVVYVASPLRFKSHGKPHGDLKGLNSPEHQQFVQHGIR